MNCMELAAVEECAPAPRYSTSPLLAGPHPEGAGEPPASVDGLCATGSSLLCTADSFLCPCKTRQGTISYPGPFIIYYPCLSCHLHVQFRLLWSLYHSPKSLFGKFCLLWRMLGLGSSLGLCSYRGTRECPVEMRGVTSRDRRD